MQAAVFLVVFALVGAYAVFNTFAAANSSITALSNSSDGMFHYTSQVKFNWSTNYTASGSDTSYYPNVEVICYQNGKWTGMGHVYRLSGTPTPSIGLTGTHTYTFAEGDLNRVDYGWYTDSSQLDQTKSESCRAALYHFSKSNHKYTELTYTTFVVNP
jgi:hypothetical protein